MGRDRYGEFDALVHDDATDAVADKLLAGKDFALTSGRKSGVPEEAVKGQSIQNRRSDVPVEIALIGEEQLQRAGAIVARAKGSLSLAADWGTEGGVPEGAVMSQLSRSKSGFIPDVTQTTEAERGFAAAKLLGSALENAGILQKAADSFSAASDPETPYDPDVRIGSNFLQKSTASPRTKQPPKSMLSRLLGR